MGDQSGASADAKESGGDSAQAEQVVKIKLLNQSDTSEAAIPVSGLDEDVATVRRKIGDKCNVADLQRIRLIYKGQVLKDGTSLADNRFNLSHALHAVVRPANVPAQGPQPAQGNAHGDPAGAPMYDDNGFVEMDFMANLLSRASLAPMRQPALPRACTHDLALVSPQNGPADLTSQAGRDSLRSMFSCSECGVVMPGSAMHCEICQIFLCPTCYRQLQTQRRGQQRNDASAQPPPQPQPMPRPTQPGSAGQPPNPFAELFARAVAGQPVAMGSFGPIPGSAPGRVPGSDQGFTAGQSQTVNGRAQRNSETGQPRSDVDNGAGGGPFRGGPEGNFGVQVIPAAEMQGLLQHLTANAGPGVPIPAWPPAASGSQAGSTSSSARGNSTAARSTVGSAGSGQGTSQTQTRTPTQTQTSSSATRAADDDSDSVPDLVDSSSCTDSEDEEAENFRHQAAAIARQSPIPEPRIPLPSQRRQQSERQPQPGEEGYVSSDGVPDLVSSSGSDSEGGELPEVPPQPAEEVVPKLSIDQLSGDLARLRQLEGFSPRLSGLAPSETAFSPEVMEFYQLYMDVSPLLLKTAVVYGQVQGNLSGQGFAPEVENFNAGMARVLRSLADVSDELADKLEHATPHARRGASGRSTARGDMPHQVPPPAIPEALGGPMPQPFAGAIPVSLAEALRPQGGGSGSGNGSRSGSGMGGEPARRQQGGARTGGSSGSRGARAATGSGNSETRRSQSVRSGSGSAGQEAGNPGASRNAVTSADAQVSRSSTAGPVDSVQASGSSSAASTSNSGPVTGAAPTTSSTSASTSTSAATTSTSAPTTASSNAPGFAFSLSSETGANTSQEPAQTQEEEPASIAAAFRDATPAVFRYVPQGMARSELPIPAILEQVRRAEPMLFPGVHAIGASEGGGASTAGASGSGARSEQSQQDLD